jgi:hypothetical protein
MDHGQQAAGATKSGIGRGFSDDRERSGRKIHVPTITGYEGFGHFACGWSSMISITSGTSLAIMRVQSRTW